MYDLDNLYLLLLTNGIHISHQDGDATWRRTRWMKIQRRTHVMWMWQKKEDTRYQNVEARSTFMTMASPNHSLASMILNEIRWVIKSDKTIVINNLAYWEKIHVLMRIAKRTLMSDVTRCTIINLNRSTIRDWFASNQVGVIRCHMEGSSWIKNPRRRGSADGWDCSNRNWTSWSGASTTTTSSTMCTILSQFHWMLEDDQNFHNACKGLRRCLFGALVRCETA